MIIKQLLRKIWNNYKFCAQVVKDLVFANKALKAANAKFSVEEMEQVISYFQQI